MPRSPRIEYAGAMYHVMNRGNRLERIYEDEEDREIFIRTLGETAKSSGWSVHSYVLMENHYHLLIETHRPTLVKGMQYLNSTYTRRYNVRHRTWGHLFQGRYKALLVDIEEGDYFQTVSDYIHLNPVRARKYKEAAGVWKDRWNSACWFSGLHGELPEWLRWERVMGELGCVRWGGKARRVFKEYFKRRVGEEMVIKKYAPYEKIRRGWCYGGERFKVDMKEKLRELSLMPRREDSWSGEAVEEMEEDRAERLLKKGRGIIKRRELKGGMGKALLARWLRTRTKVGVKWIAKELGTGNTGSMSFLIWKAGEITKNDRKAIQIWKQLENLQ